MTNRPKTLTSIALLVGLSGVVSIALAGDDNSIGASPESGTTITIHNALPASDVCPNGNSLSVFVGNQPQQVVAHGDKLTVSGDLSALPGVGIQINNWYWLADKSPVEGPGGSQPQNPDNSGAQFAVSADCSISQETPPWFGKGIPTYQVAEVSAGLDAQGRCELTIRSNGYTDAVTPGCCSPPGIGSQVCQSSQWGVTANGAAWPPN